MNKCNRAIQHVWLTKYPWLVYSSKLDGGGGCLLYDLFAINRASQGILVNALFTQWTNGPPSD